MVYKLIGAGHIFHRISFLGQGLSGIFIWCRYQPAIVIFKYLMHPDLMSFVGAAVRLKTGVVHKIHFSVIIYHG